MARARLIRAAAAVITLTLAPAAMAQQEGGVPEPDGYRGPPYFGEVPATLAGARVIDGAEARRLHAAGVPFLDVYPRPTRPAGLPAGTLWRTPSHESIPGALWLPGTGYERLTLPEAARLAAGLRAATGGDPAAPVVIFCRADCWQSWNAARRAVAAGYRGILWFPDGSEGWVAAGGMLDEIRPPGE